MRYECRNCLSDDDLTMPCVIVIPGKDNQLIRDMKCILRNSHCLSNFKESEVDKSSENQQMLKWISEGNIGASSLTLWAAIMGFQSEYPSVPHDSDDFERCYLLLKVCNKETKIITLKRVARWFQAWKSFAENWRQLEELYERGEIAILCAKLKDLRSV